MITPFGSSDAELIVTQKNWTFLGTGHDGDIGPLQGFCLLLYRVQQNTETPRHISTPGA
jgi:hypothetical protein